MFQVVQFTIDQNSLLTLTTTQHLFLDLIAIPDFAAGVYFRLVTVALIGKNETYISVYYVF